MLSMYARYKESASVQCSSNIRFLVIKVAQSPLKIEAPRSYVLLMFILLKTNFYYLLLWFRFETNQKT
jgi:hypothetical protein